MRALRPVTAVLGPTNTGKTHLAVERMLAHGGGMIGLPLRLLAREIYDRVRLKVGDHAVALVTGEEKIIPASPRYWVATVEAMPPDLNVPFVAIDECQLCADFERGAIFTDRVLSLRGSEETMLLGAGTMRPILEALLPRVEFISRPRFSKLTYAGIKKISRLPRRSAIVAFSADMVYAVAELIRRQNGGAAVVMGALSPRTRNAQVALYQSGDVDYIVATDAIGMGLNMNVDHVAFAATRKFDGFQFRELNPSEMAQVAGRAGRFMKDGTFGGTGEVTSFEPELIERLENHHFDTVRTLQWRNPDLDFSSLERLKRSLEVLPSKPGLTRAQAGADIIALETVSRDSETARYAQGRKGVELLWSCCKIPDYRNISPAEHAHLVGKVFSYLAGPKGHIDEDWFARQLHLCENFEGDIDALSNRISHVRTWTFIANRANWLPAPQFWQRRAGEIEEKLSDALHIKLTQRFIDRRTSVLMRRLAQKEELMSTVEENGAILVEGEYVGRVEGFNFIPDGAQEGPEQRTLRAAALAAVTSEIQARAIAASASADPDLKITRDGQIIWNHQPIGVLEAGDDLLKPQARVLASDLLNGPSREIVRERLQKFTDRHIATVLEPLVKLHEAEGLTGMARGLAFRVVEHLGVLPREPVAEEVKALSQDERAALRQFGLRFGAFHLFTPVLLKPAATELRLLLWGLQQKKTHGTELAALPQPPGQGLTSAVFDRSTPVGFYGICGYRICGSRVVRVDMLERLADLIRERVFWRARFPEEARPSGSVEGGGFTIVPDMMSLVGCSGEEFEGILKSLGFRMQKKSVPKPPPPAVEAAKAAVVGAEADAGDAILAAAETEAGAVPDVVAETIEPVAPEMGLPPVVAVEPEIVAAVVPEPPVAVVAETVPAEAMVAADGAETAGAVEAAALVPAVEMIELSIWWPKDTGPFRHRHEPRERKLFRSRANPAAGQPGAEGVAQEAGAVAPAEGAEAQPRRSRDEMRRKNGDHKGRGHKKSGFGEGRERGAERSDERSASGHRNNKGNGSHNGHESKGPKSRPERPLDPTSPFAVLMELKNKMSGAKS